jgi:hypothetical protein
MIQKGARTLAAGKALVVEENQSRRNKKRW